MKSIQLMYLVLSMKSLRKKLTYTTTKGYHGHEPVGYRSTCTKALRFYTSKACLFGMCPNRYNILLDFLVDESI